MARLSRTGPSRRPNKDHGGERGKEAAQPEPDRVHAKSLLAYPVVNDASP